MDFRFRIKNFFHYFNYFYQYLRYRIFIAIFLSLLVGLLDSVGIALFIPLFKMISSEENTGDPVNTESSSDFISSFIVDNLGVAPSLFNFFLLIFTFFILKGIAKYFEAYMRILYQQSFMRKIRVSNIDLFGNSSFNAFLRADTGRIQNTFSGEVQRVNSAYKFYLKTVQMGALVFVYIILALGADWKFTLLVIFGASFLNLIFRRLYKQTKFFSRQYTLESHKFQNLLVQTVHFFQYLKATGLTEIYNQKLKKNILKVEAVQQKLGKVDSLLAGLREPLTILVIFGAIFVNIYVFNENLGNILLSLILLYRGITFFIGVQEQWNSFLSTSGSLDNMKIFTSELKKNKEQNGNQIFSSFANSLVLRNLSFGFHMKEPILQDINLTIYKNETIAIVGESGAGKSTLMNILAGLVRPVSGEYKIDNLNINELNLNSFRSRIGYILQDAVIFNDTVFNNITFWAPKTDKNFRRFRWAAEKAEILQFIKDLPQHEETVLGSNGINISGGQKQRLSIARELYKDVDFLFMDEATSALDGETEAAVQQNIKNLKGEYTIIIIAHRLATVRDADRIVLMDSGKLSAQGSFQQLYHNSEEFRAMVALQNLSN
ncbi:ABC transporter ATP-binding protein [Zunongwangia sp. F260]|uniref:ABC transporter ATP-binding protein n=1 Tax=Autumnicola lenta TaxID=3075593 RepID=A0ABU3CMM7_9FLAO|nr:ABC transporter ATP-binding protein [Zunongwangia sp. F260]MDT0647594.1 ABC transporter ATP-binding protein [Zunongwangia sp. F260]